MTSNQNNEWLKEYSEFMQADATSVPKEITERVWTKIDRLLNPSALSVFSKVLAIHGVTGFLSLAVCSQFGVNPFRTSWSLSDLFMNYGGHSFCMLACGVLFISVSLFAAGLFLSVEEVKALRRTEFSQTLALSIISLGLFAAVGAELALTFAGLWLLGGLVGGFFATEALWQMKRA